MTMWHELSGEYLVPAVYWNDNDEHALVYAMFSGVITVEDRPYAIFNNFGVYDTAVYVPIETAVTFQEAPKPQHPVVWPSPYDDNWDEYDEFYAEPTNEDILALMILTGEGDYLDGAKSV
jgi:hypothetical protein